MTRLVAWLDAVALRGPGLVDWSSAAAMLGGREPYLFQPTLLPPPTCLPATERRRVGRPVRLALSLGLEAAAAARLETASLATVFTSSGGDGENCHSICETLASSDRQLSPTRFHNSVHNAPAGYWGIATGAQVRSTALCAFDASFAAGLLETCVQVATSEAPVMLVAHDDRYPPPLHAKRALAEAFGVALILLPAAGPGSLARLEVGLEEAQPDRLPDPAFEALRLGTPAARCLPLLRALAQGARRSVRLEYLGATALRVDLEPC